jgi:hypothetical protein
MRRILSLMSTFALTVLTSSTLGGQIATRSGLGTVTFMDSDCLKRPQKPTRCFTVPAAKRAEAERMAELYAIERSAADQGAAAFANYERVRAQVEADPSPYVLSRTVLTESIDSTRGTYLVSMRFELNVTRLEALVASATTTMRMRATDRPVIALVFMSRRQAVSTAFDVERTDRDVTARTTDRAQKSSRTASSAQQAQSSGVSVRDSTGSLVERDSIAASADSELTTTADVARTQSARGRQVIGGTRESRRDSVPTRRYELDDSLTIRQGVDMQGAERTRAGSRSTTSEQRDAARAATERQRQAGADSVATTFADSAESREVTRTTQRSAVERTTSGISTTRADVIKREVISSSDVNVAMSGVLVQNGYEIVDAEFIDTGEGATSLLQQVRTAFASGDDLPAPLLRQLVAAVREAGAQFLAFGTLDVGMLAKDGVSGLQRTDATVTGKLLDVSGRLPRTITAVGPIAHAGLGRDLNSASTAALKLAAEATGRELSQRLSQRQP